MALLDLLAEKKFGKSGSRINSATARKTFHLFRRRRESNSDLWVCRRTVSHCTSRPRPLSLTYLFHLKLLFICIYHLWGWNYIFSFNPRQDSNLRPTTVHMIEQSSLRADFVISHKCHCFSSISGRLRNTVSGTKLKASSVIKMYFFIPKIFSSLRPFSSFHLFSPSFLGPWLIMALVALLYRGHMLSDNIA